MKLNKYFILLLILNFKIFSMSGTAETLNFDMPILNLKPDNSELNQIIEEISEAEKMGYHLEKVFLLQKLEKIINNSQDSQ